MGARTRPSLRLSPTDVLVDVARTAVNLFPFVFGRGFVDRVAVTGPGTIRARRLDLAQQSGPTGSTSTTGSSAPAADRSSTIADTHD